MARFGLDAFSGATKERFRIAEAPRRRQVRNEAGLARVPYFCSGCPHNSSTKLPDGSMGMAGIGCHTLAIGMERNTKTFTHMGAEGASWVGASHFTDMPHVFQNLGDGTYFHSGYLAIRHAIATNTNITYKILYNDAVAMTGGQPHDGDVHPWTISQQVHAEGVRRIALVSDDPDKYPLGTNWAPGVSFHHRDQLDDVQRDLREWKGVSVLIYDQTCAAEKRRRRKRGTFPDPNRRAFINEAVCEGCGDCSTQSNCLSVVPQETEFGRKRAIDQSSCNKDFSCLKGFCPSFVTVEGGSLRKGKVASAKKTAEPAAEPALPPAPSLPSVEAKPYGVLITGIGGTGVVTIGAIMGMAAHIEGKGATVLDQLGMAQKGGAVISHVRIGATPEALHAMRLGAGGANLLLGCDLVVSASADALARLEPGLSKAVVNTHETITGEFTRRPDLAFPANTLKLSVEAAAGADAVDFLDATGIATGLMGDSIATNMFVLGYAYQKGLVPLGHAAIEQAIELNGAAVPMNLAAFRWGRRAAADRAFGRAADRAEGQQQRRAPRAAPLHHPGRDRGGPDEASHRLPERSPCPALRRACREGARRRAAQGRRQDRPRRSRGALLRQAALLQGRVRGRAALQRGGVPGKARPAVRGRLQAEVPPRAAAVLPARSADRPPDQAGVRKLDAAGLPPAGEARRACAAPPSIPSAAPKSARPSAA